MKQIITIIFLLGCFLGFGQNKKKVEIQSDGFYKTECIFEKDDTEGTLYCLRFYSNGKILSVSTECETTPEDLKEWFNMEIEYPSIGNYEVKGKRIYFSTTSRSGTVKYKGRITKNGIIKLKSKSLINGYKSREEYHFIKVNDFK